MSRRRRLQEEEPQEKTMRRRPQSFMAIFSEEKVRPYISYKTLKEVCDPKLFKTKLFKHFFKKLNPVMATSLCPVMCESQVGCEP